MFSDTESVQLLFNASTLILISGIIIILVFTYFVYKITIPQISRSVKSFLITLRVIILALLLLLIFEPVLKISSSDVQDPVTVIFIDNSNSMILTDSAESSEKIESTAADLYSNLKYEKKMYSFGVSPGEINPDSLSELNFQERVTNIETVFSQLESEPGNVTSAVIISDGIIDNGSTSLSNIEKLGLPINTIGIGDTTQRRNIQINKINTNRFIYAEKETEIEVVILNTGMGGRSDIIHLYEDNKLLESKNIALNESGINRVTFTYYPEVSGEKKIRVSADYLGEEHTSQDNSKTIYISVLNNKLNVSIVAGSPSSDLAFIKSSLEMDKNLTVEDFSQITGTKFSNRDFNELDSADILFLLGFPASNTPEQLINKVNSLIIDSNIPYFYLMGISTDFSKLSRLNNSLSFNYRKVTSSIIKVQPVISNINTGILKINSRIEPQLWANLAPVNSFDIDYGLKPGSVMIASAKSGNIDTGIPILISSAMGSDRNISMLCFDIWKWKLASNEENRNLFDQFIANVIKWLNIDKSKRRFTVNTPKKVYTRGEPVEFTAELYDDLYQPVNNANIYIVYNENGNERKLFFEPAGDGIYEASMTSNIPGDIKFSAFAELDNVEKGHYSGTITIEDVNLESLNLQMDTNFLHKIANNTGGIFSPADSVDEIVNHINSFNMGRSRIFTNNSEFKFWTNEWILLAIILLFAIEWFIRKRMGML